MKSIYLTVVLAPLIGSIIAGLFGRQIGRAGAHTVTILGVGIAFVGSLLTLKHLVLDGGATFNETIYTWAVSDGLHMEVGFMVDNLTAMMMSVVTFVSLLVHIYTIGYMADEDHNWPGYSKAGPAAYQRFFSYISLFTFSMLMLVMSNNFMQLFFGWEAVGLVSYLLIGFWSSRPTAVFANMKAFLVNRVGDFGFLLGIAAIVMYFGSLDYLEVFAKAPEHANTTVSLIEGEECMLLNLIGVLLFIGAMGKSAQAPLHVWLPDSMEGPTPISALIHAATMVTAGIFMVARMSPIYEHAVGALSVILVIGALTAFFTGLIGLVQSDIKRVVAYSTLSQLGYMTVALGASAYAGALFHLMTHAFFKALLFLAAGSVIIAMHHVQDMRQMGGLRKYMPITYWTSLIGSLALIGFPGFSGFYSKDLIIEAVHHSQIPGATFAYWMVLLGVFVTALYSFRMFFLVFHGEERMDDHTKHHLHETPWVVTLPLVLLAIPSIFIGFFTIEPMLFGEYFKGILADGVLQRMDAHEPLHMITASVTHPPFWLALGGVAMAYFLYMKPIGALQGISRALSPIGKVLEKKYYFDEIYQAVFAGGARALGGGLWKFGDVALIDGLLVNGTAKSVGVFSGLIRHFQTGYLYHYAFAMIIGLLGLLSWAVAG
ncbi:MAG: NADH-quinone oxidoreductase subunit L [Gammaproteobacteria bacterium]